MEAFLGGFPCRLATGFVLNLSTNRGLWERITTTLPIDTSEKFIEVKDNRDLYRTINPSQLEQRYGGTAENLMIFWPPIFSSKLYRAEEAVELGDYSSLAEYFPEAIAEPEDSGLSSIPFPEVSSKPSLNLSDPFALACGPSGDLQTIQESTNANVESSEDTLTLTTQLNAHQLRVNMALDWRPRAEIAVAEEESGTGGCGCSSTCALA